MRKEFLSMAAALVIVVACGETLAPQRGARNCILVLNAVPGADDCKGAMSQILSQENVINSLGFFVFDENGVLESIRFTDGNEPAPFNLRCGYKTIWAVANLQEDKFSQIETLDQMDDIRISLEENQMGNLPMAGRMNLILEKETALNISLERFLCRLYVDRIENALSDELQGEEIVLKTIFMSNVVGECTIDGSVPDNTIWINECGRDEDSCITAACQAACSSMTAMDINQTINCGETLPVGRFIYFMPNPTLQDVVGHETAFTPRYTRIVTVAEIGEYQYFYAVNIPLPQRNTAYAMALSIRSPGSIKPESSEYAKVQTFPGFEISVWDDLKYLDFNF